ncbi:MAG TPA: membrane dipeptidase [Alphaproteobacteria bacterium]|nr:membrane dipeptidase [Alphaproteobacteria bacterium]
MTKANAKQRAAKLYAKALVWDDHSGFDPHGGADLNNLDIWRKAGVDYLSVNVGYDVVDWQATIKTIARFRAFLQTHPKKFALIRSVADIKRARRAGKLAIAFDLEGMNSLNGDVNMVNVYYELGVRQMLFAYNLNNLAGGGCHDGNKGLTDFGRAVIKEMNRVGMMVDCSHTAYRTTMEAMEASAAPVIFSHSCAKAIHGHGRNIVDEQIKACARTGGVVGVNGVSMFLGENDISSETFVRHVAHMADLVGAEHVGIALDYAFDADKVDDLVEGNSAYWPESAGYGRHPTSYVPPKQLREITETMVRHGFKDREILGILGGNFMRVASAVWK